MQQWPLAVAAILVAGILDAADGRLARFLGSTTDFRAELDSLSDFVSFGVAPALIVYLFVLQKWDGVGWGIVLLFSTCTGLRLARFNLRRITKTNIGLVPNFFYRGTGPCGGFFGFGSFDVHLCSSRESPLSSLYFRSFYRGFCFAYDQQNPHLSFKNLHLSHRAMVPALACVALCMALFWYFPWMTLCALGLFYMGSIPCSLRIAGRKKIKRTPHKQTQSQGNSWKGSLRTNRSLSLLIPHD